MTNSQQIKRLVGIAILTALVVALQFLSNYVKFGPVEITLALIPIAVGAVLYGPLAGAFLGAVMGGIVIAAPTTLAVFVPANPAATIILCILKTALAGFVAGWVYRGIAHFAKKAEDKKKKVIIALAITVAAIVIPVINTAIFILGALVFYMDVFGDFTTLVTAVITVNFAIEFAVSVVLSPAVVTIIKVSTTKYDLGFSNDFSSLHDEDVEELDEVLEEDIIKEA